MPRRLRLLQLLAGLIPLSGCLALLIAGDPAHFASFRLLLTALIGLGMVGFGLAVHLGSLLGRMVTALTGPDT